jgi:hypothetical protein
METRSPERLLLKHENLEREQRQLLLSEVKDNIRVARVAEKDRKQRIEALKDTLRRTEQALRNHLISMTGRDSYRPRSRNKSEELAMDLGVIAICAMIEVVIGWPSFQHITNGEIGIFYSFVLVIASVSSAMLGAQAVAQWVGHSDAVKHWNRSFSSKANTLIASMPANAGAPPLYPLSTKVVVTAIFGTLLAIVINVGQLVWRLDIAKKYTEIADATATAGAMILALNMIYYVLKVSRSTPYNEEQFETYERLYSEASRLHTQLKELEDVEEVDPLEVPGIEYNERLNEFETGNQPGELLSTKIHYLELHDEEEGLLRLADEYFRRLGNQLSDLLCREHGAKHVDIKIDVYEVDFAGSVLPDIRDTFVDELEDFTPQTIDFPARVRITDDELDRYRLQFMREVEDELALEDQRRVEDGVIPITQQLAAPQFTIGGRS